MATGDVGTARLSIDDVQATNSGGWGVAFWGGYSQTGEYGEYNGYTLQFDKGLGDRIVIRQWVDGRAQGVELTPFVNVAAADFGIDLFSPMDVALDLNSGALTLDVTQSGVTVRVFDIPDLPAIATQPLVARSSGFLGVRTWNNAQLSIGHMAVTFLE